MAYDLSKVREYREKIDFHKREQKRLGDELSHYKKWNCDHSKMYTRHFYDGSSEVECDICGISKYQCP